RMQDLALAASEELAVPNREYAVLNGDSRQVEMPGRLITSRRTPHGLSGRDCSQSKFSRWRSGEMRKSFSSNTTLFPPYMGLVVCCPSLARNLRMPSAMAWQIRDCASSFERPAVAMTRSVAAALPFLPLRAHQLPALMRRHCRHHRSPTSAMQP